MFNTSSFAEGLVQSMTASLDPMNGVVRKYAEETTEQVRNSTRESKAELIEKIERKLTEAEARDARSAVIQAYEKLLTDLTS